MKNNKNILVINTGGTFNKQYNPLDGSLMIKKNNDLVKELLNKAQINTIEIKGILYKDSLDITNEDRELLAKLINQTKYKKIIIIHGTDTMDKTALYLDENIKNKQIVLTGAMVPYSISKIEAISNFMIGYGYLLSKEKNGVMIAMHGMVKKYKKIKKNRELGVFECQ
ncbi:MAG: asparaginase domain-containing protein [Arcobacteraceae bacterium]|nr:asparaginase domain-containing protein [Arcobacteraceae bacterium]